MQEHLISARAIARWWLQPLTVLEREQADPIQGTANKVKACDILECILILNSTGDKCRWQKQPLKWKEIGRNYELTPRTTSRCEKRRYFERITQTLKSKKNAPLHYWLSHVSQCRSILGRDSRLAALASGVRPCRSLFSSFLYHATTRSGPCLWVSPTVKTCYRLV